MFTAYVVLTVLAAATTAFAATADFLHPQWLLANMAKVGVPRSWLFPLGALKAAGALGLLVGLGVPLVGVVAAVGLVLFFVGTRSPSPWRFSCRPLARWGCDWPRRKRVCHLQGSGVLRWSVRWCLGRWRTTGRALGAARSARSG